MVLCLKNDNMFCLLISNGYNQVRIPTYFYMYEKQSIHLLSLSLEAYKSLQSYS